MMIDTDSPEFEDAVMEVVRRRLDVSVQVKPESDESCLSVEVSLKDKAIEINYLTSDQIFAWDCNN